ncbi:MAG: nucleotidyltransferase family protein [Clostridiales bacterium]|nr:nucleotidyltransferase family protein [Clostridiales bacterium]
MNQQLLTVLSSLFTIKEIDITDEIKKEAVIQSVYSLIGSDADALAVITRNIQVIYEQCQLATVFKGIPYVILKGTAAAVYYPEPLRRTLGDIDILVKPEYFEQAYNALISSGYVKDSSVYGGDRHERFFINGVTVELHRRFAQLNSLEQEKMLDTWLFEAEPVEGKIDSHIFPMLPEPLSGISLLAHISQHLESGLGLRHILDFVMYVDKALDDEKWHNFKELTDILGLTKLAETAAFAGQKYFGAYPDYRWCRSADVKLCEEFMDYALSCGDFGVKLGDKNIVETALSRSIGLKHFLGNLQKRGEENWSVLMKWPGVKPLAGFYQAGRYFTRGIKSGLKPDDLKYSLEAGKRRNNLVKALGAKQQSVRDGDG